MMQIALFTNMENIQSLLESDERISNVIRFSEFEEKEIHCDAVLLSGDVVRPNELRSYREKFPKIPVIYKMARTTNAENVATICNVYDIKPLYEYLTEVQTVNKLFQIVFGDKNESKTNVVSFFGTHSGAGLSTTVLNVGKVLSESIQHKVLILSLNPWDPSDYFLPYEGKYLDDIQIELQNELFTEESLKEAVVSYSSNFFHLAGNRNIKLQRFYKEQQVDRLIEIAKQTFDIVLIDAGAHFDNAAYAQSYLSSDLKFLITTQEEKGWQSYFPHIYNQLIKPVQQSKDDYILIINRYEKEMNLIRDIDLQEKMEMNLLTTIANQNIFGHIAVSQKKLLVNLVEGDYRESMQIIANSIIKRTNLTPNENVDLDFKKRKKLFGFIPVKA